MVNNQSSTIQPVDKHIKLSEKSSDDRISKLPEPILHHILSFLSTKQAATTIVLSKQWRCLWTWVPDLDITRSEIRAKYTSFECIIFKIFLSRRAWCIRKFRLSCPYSESDCGLVSIRFILCAAVEREVEELDFRISDRENEFFELPTSLLCCKTLVVLKLRGDIKMGTGSSLHFPSLKVLHLVRVWFENHDTFRSLISACPVLDYLLVVSDGSVVYNGSRYVDGTVIHNGYHYEISSITLRHFILRKGRIGFRRTPLKITVSAPALEYLIVDYDYAPCVLVLNSVSSSVHVNISISLLQLRDDSRFTIKDMIGALCNVQFLELNFRKIAVPDHCIPNDIFPIFDNLVQLKLLGRSCLLSVLINILCNCSLLEHLTLPSGIRYCPCKRNPNCWISPQHVPDYLTFHLTTIKFEGFEGLEAEMEFVQYVLKNSKVLKNMTISYQPEMNSKTLTPTPACTTDDIFLKFLYREETLGMDKIDVFHQGKRSSMVYKDRVVADNPRAWKALQNDVLINATAELKVALTTKNRYKIMVVKGKRHGVNMQGRVKIGSDGKISGKKKKIKLHHAS